MDKPFHILYVDDEEDNLTAFKAVFRRYYKITLAQSGKAALELLKVALPNIIIADQRMPEMTGAQLLEQVRSEYPRVIRMILTGYSDIKAIVNAINDGKIYHYLTKPWDFDEVKIVIDNALETQQLRQRNQQLLLRNLQLEKENALAQFQSLKNQLNPHFLFNSLNILRALITEDTDRAFQYATNFSKLYRRLLELKDQKVISLSEELEFVAHYIFLQKTRFEDSLIVKIDIPDTRLSDCLPPFTLQLLLENAIKHNITSSAKPLNIEVWVDDTDHLVVQNNLQLRGTKEESTGIGLNNLMARYQLITQQALDFKTTSKHYIARVPLIVSV
ncbi:MAG: histidine kinase [Bacteroidota bacterium]